MSGITGISYLDATWPVVSGCTPVSAGCANCWARAMDTRFGDGHFSVHCHPERLDQPLHWRKPRRIGVAFTGDLFHEDVPQQFIADAMNIMYEAAHHTFLILTKRPQRMQKWCDYHWTTGPPNVWAGVSVEDQATTDARIPLLLQTPAAKRVVSLEPMLSPVDLSPYLPLRCCSGVDCACMGTTINPPPFIDWVILGSESGPHRRYCDPAWMVDVVRQCKAAGVPCYVKQTHIGSPDRFFVSHNPESWPMELRVREVPK